MSSERPSPTSGPRRALVMASKRLMAALRSPRSEEVLLEPVAYGPFTRLHGHKHCLLVSYRRDGRPVAQPVWPGYDGDRLFVWTEAEAFKAKRLRNNPAALLAPCTVRGVPLGPPLAATGRVLADGPERRHAEAVLRSQWGWKRKTFERVSRPLTDVVYLELIPARRPATAPERAPATREEAVSRL